MPVPETTSAEAFERYVGGKSLVASRGERLVEIALDVIAKVIRCVKTRNSLRFWHKNGLPTKTS